MVNAAEAGPILWTGNPLVLEVEDGQVDVAVAQEIARGVVAVQLGNLPQAKDLGVKLGRGIGILSSNGDMFNLSQLVSSCRILLGLGRWSRPELVLLKITLLPVVRYPHFVRL